MEEQLRLALLIVLRHVEKCTSRVLLIDMGAEVTKYKSLPCGYTLISLFTFVLGHLLLASPCGEQSIFYSFWLRF